MKIFWMILKAFLTLLALLIIAIAGFVFYLSFDKIDTFYLRNAAFVDYEYLYEYDRKISNNDQLALRDEMNIYVHRISHGKGVIFAYRWFSNGDVGAIDDEVFKKITVWIPSLPEKYPAEFSFANSRAVSGVYTHGGAAWPKAACSGYLTSGLLKLDKVNDSIKVTINSKLILAGSKIYGYNCAENELNIDFETKEIKFNELTPWLGLMGDHPYAETYR